MAIQDRILSEPSPAENALCEQVIGAAIEVHRALGPGLPEMVYQQALCIELTERGIAFTRERIAELSYKGHVVGRIRIDLLVADAIVVELKALEAIHDVHKAQVLSYLRITGCRLGLLINFNVPLLRDGIRRIICSA